MNTLFFYRQQHGFVLLVTVLIIGAVGTAIAIALPLIGVSVAQMGITLQQSSQAKGLADACAEYALDKLRDSDAYAGSETLNLGNGSCEIRPVLGSGNSNRTVQATGTVETVSRKVQVQISTVSPQLVLSNWREVWEFP